MHTTGGYALYAMHTTATSFGLTQQTGPSNSNASNKDVYACVADAGWITGHTYIVSNPSLVHCVAGAPIPCARSLLMYQLFLVS